MTAKRSRKKRAPTMVERQMAKTSSREDIKLRLLQVHEILSAAALLQAEEAARQARQLGTGEPQLQQLISNLKAVQGQAWFLAQSVSVETDHDAE